MAVVVAYDSGAGTPLEPDIWLSYRRSTSLSLSPVAVTLRIIPLETPQGTWNLLGYACIETERQGVRLIGPQTPVSSVDNEFSPSTLLYSVEHRIAANRVDGFRGVYWNVNRWVGTYRAIVTVID